MTLIDGDVAMLRERVRDLESRLWVEKERRDIDGDVFEAELGRVNDEHAAEMAKVRAELAAKDEEIGEWQDASGLCVPSEERGGDPGGVKPRHLVREMARMTAEIERAHEMGERHGDAEMYEAVTAWIESPPSPVVNTSETMREAYADPIAVERDRLRADLAAAVKRANEAEASAAAMRDALTGTRTWILDNPGPNSDAHAERIECTLSVGAGHALLDRHAAELRAKDARIAELEHGVQLLKDEAKEVCWRWEVASIDANKERDQAKAALANANDRIAIYVKALETRDDARDADDVLAQVKAGRDRELMERNRELDAEREQHADTKAALAKVRHDLDEMIRVHDEVERQRDEAQAVLAKSNEENARLRADVRHVSLVRFDMQAALGRAMASLRAVRDHGIPSGTLSELQARIDAILADPAGQAAAEVWTAAEAVAEYVRANGGYINLAAGIGVHLQRLVDALAKVAARRGQ